jgi:iron complex transport system ATP-binding protein
MIETTSLSIDLGRSRVIEDASVSLAPGRITAIIGANGAGKTSLLRALCGLVAPSAGQVTLNGATLTSFTDQARARRIGYLPQNGHPAWAITVRELAELGRLPHRSRFSAADAQDVIAVDDALAATDTLHLANRSVEALSGGERARAKMARVIAGAPDWIMADEPLANLDPPHQRDLLRLFRRLAQNGKGVVTVLHQIDAAATADDLIILKAGRVIAAGPVAETLTPAHLEAAFDMAFTALDHDGRRIVIPA